MGLLRDNLDNNQKEDIREISMFSFQNLKEENLIINIVKDLIPVLERELKEINQSK